MGKKRSSNSAPTEAPASKKAKVGQQPNSLNRKTPNPQNSKTHSLTQNETRPASNTNPRHIHNAKGAANGRSSFSKDHSKLSPNAVVKALANVVEAVAYNVALEEEVEKQYGRAVIQDIQKLHKDIFGKTHSYAQLEKDRPKVGTEVSMTSHETIQSLGKVEQKPPLPDVQLLPSLESKVFTHPSMVSNRSRSSGGDQEETYEQLEFIGDAYIEIIATRLIASRFPHLVTGHLAHVREELVCNKSLSQFSSLYGFDKRLRVTENEKKDAKALIKIHGDVFEAYVAAVIMSDPETGFGKCEDWLAALWAEQLLQHSQPVDFPHSKNELERLIGGPSVRLAYMQEKEMERVSNRTQWNIGLYFTGYEHENLLLGRGTGQNKVQAGNLAAHNALTLNQRIVDELHQRKVEELAKFKAAKRTASALQDTENAAGAAKEVNATQKDATEPNTSSGSNSNHPGSVLEHNTTSDAASPAVSATVPLGERITNASSSSLANGNNGEAATGASPQTLPTTNTSALNAKDKSGNNRRSRKQRRHLQRDRDREAQAQVLGQTFDHLPVHAGGSGSNGVTSGITAPTTSRQPLSSGDAASRAIYERPPATGPSETERKLLQDYADMQAARQASKI